MVGMIRNQPGTKFKFEILRPGAAQIPIQVGAIRHFGHQRFAKAEDPVVVVVFGNDADGVAAGVGRIVVGAVVVDRPVHELVMAVAANVVQIEKIGHAEFAARAIRCAGPAG